MANLENNNIKVGGYLIAKTITLGKTSTGNEYISARLTLQVGENDGERVDLEAFANKLTSSGQPNKIYQSLMTVNEEYKSLDSQFCDKRMRKDAQPVKHESTTVATKEEVDFVYANKGVKLTNNRYMSNGELVTTFRLTTNFFNRAKEGANREPYIEGTLRGVCASDAQRLYDSDEEVVGLKLEFYVPEFRNGYTNRMGEEIPDSVAVEKFDLFLRDLEMEGALEYCEEEFVKGVVCEIGVQPMLRIEQETKKVDKKEKRGFGNVPTFEPSTKLVKEIKLIGGFVMDESEYEGDPAFDFNAIGEGVQALNKKIEELKENEGKVVETAPRGFGAKKSGSGMNLPF